MGGQCGIASQPSYPKAGGPAPPTPPSGKTHYGDPADGCESDEQAVRVQGVAGSFCSPDCASAACPTDVPSGVTAAPQCALKSTTGDKKCALLCSPSTDEASLRAGDAMCGKATCQPIQSVGICTYGGGLPLPLDLLLLVTVASPLASSAHRRSLAVCPSASRVLDPVLSALLATLPLAAHASRSLTQAFQCLAQVPLPSSLSSCSSKRAIILRCEDVKAIILDCNTKPHQ